jgi:hypothetical protein
LISFECNYSTYSNATGKHNFVEKLNFSLVWDRAKKTAYLLGNNGSAEINPIEGRNGKVTFIEVTDFGNVITTTIFETGDSVHSRNLTTPSQAYGKCRVL